VGGDRRRRLTIWGYDDFEVYETRENGLPDYEGGIVTHEYLRELVNHLEADEEFDIQTAGSPSAASQSWPSSTSFAMAKSSTRTSVPRSRSGDRTARTEFIHLPEIYVAAAHSGHYASVHVVRSSQRLDLQVSPLQAVSLGRPTGDLRFGQGEVADGRSKRRPHPTCCCRSD